MPASPRSSSLKLRGCGPAIEGAKEQVAGVAATKRRALLGAYSGWLSAEDLEDCYSQATLELLMRVRQGRPFAGPRHVTNALEQKFRSRIQDRRRALRGRSAMQAALAAALPLGEPDDGGIDVADTRESTEEAVASRLRLRRLIELAASLSADQRMVLACQVGLGMGGAEFCERFAWSAEKYRKVAQRGRARLRSLAGEESPCPAHRKPSEGVRGSIYDAPPQPS